MLLTVYSAALGLVLLLSAPWWLLRMAATGKYREGLLERLGRLPPRLSKADERPSIWVHAVSVGEVLAASRLVRELVERAPGHRIVLSTTTRTGQTLARERLGADRCFYLPLDFAWAVRPYLRVLRPQLLVLVETEFWPNLLGECRRAGIAVAVVNGRVSDRSLPRYLRLRALWRRILASLSLVLAQSEEDARRLVSIGAPADRVRYGGNLKFDVRAADEAPLTRTVKAQLAPGTRVLVCGSTLEGEEELLLQAWSTLRRTTPELVMILAPRHPERFGAVSSLLDAKKTNFVRRSKWMKRPARIRPGTVMLLDSIGELASIYSLAAVAFVGGSLVGVGGHNPLEPAQFAVPVVMGPHYENFRAIVEKMLDAEAIKIATTETLTPILQSLFTDKEAANALGLHALEVFESETGATGRAITELLRLLPEHTLEMQSAARARV